MMLSIQVITLGPGDPGLLTLHALEALKSQKTHLILRTGRHPVAGWLQDQGISFDTLDGFYDRYDNFDEMHQAMGEYLWNLASDQPISYAVANPGEDGSVLSLKQLCPDKGQLNVLPGVSAESACLSSCAYHLPGEHGIRRITASSISGLNLDPDVPLFVTEINSALLAGDVKVRLSEVYPDEQEIIFFPPSEAFPRPYRTIPLYMLDGQRSYDHTAAAFFPQVGFLSRTRFTMSDLEKIVNRLCARDGCPWDRIQTHESLRPYLVEEAWEAVNAIDEKDMDHLEDELGDVLFQVLIHSTIARKFDEFNMTDVVSGISKKMIRRHPHVFQLSHGETAAEIADGWEEQKRKETGSMSVGESLNDVSFSLPALKYAIKTNKKLGQLSALRREPNDIAEDIRRFSRSLVANGKLSESNMANLLIRCTELCYRTDCDAEILLHQGTLRMVRRFQKAEINLRKKGLRIEDMSSAELMTILNENEDVKDET